MSPEIIIVLAILAVAVIALTQRGKGEGEDAPASHTARLPDVAQPGEALQMQIGDLSIPYCLDVQRATNGPFTLEGEFWQRYTDQIDLAGLGEGAHETVNLGHDESLRSARAGLLPIGAHAPTLGQGLARGYFEGHPDLPPEMAIQHIAVIECFDKTEGLPVLLPASARVLPRHGLAVRNVIRHVAGDAVRVRFVFHDANTLELLADSGWHDVPHSQTLAGPDVARALFPALGVVRARQCRIAYSRTPLEPVTPHLPNMREQA